MGEHGILWQGVALTGAAVDRRRRPQWIRAWATIAGSFVANQIVKFAVRRPRPDLADAPPLMGTLSNRSYPSAHATTAACAARILPPLVAGASGRRASVARRSPRASVRRTSIARGAFASAAIAMSYSRLYLGVHWPSDVIAGYALGAAIGELAS